MTEFYGLDIVVGSNIGSLKHIKYNSNPKKKQHIKNLQNIKELEKGQGITCMSWIDAEQSKFIFARQNRTVQTYDLVHEEFSDLRDVDFGEGRVRSLSVYGESVVGAVESGTIKIWKSSSSDEFILDTGGPIEKMTHSPYNPLVIASGGKENDLKLWDLEKKTMVFHAKNVPHDWLQLRVPIWVSDICFLPESNGNVVATCSRYGAVRLYDARTQRRPVCDVDFKDQAGSCIALGHHDKHVLVGTGRGVLNLIDLRMKGKLSKMYKGATGAITEVKCLKDRNIVISTSLDRHMRIHSADTKAMIHKQYLTSKLSSFLLRTVDSFIKQDFDENITIKEELEDDIKEEDFDQEYEDLFDNMEVISEEKIKKKKMKAKVSNTIEKINSSSSMGLKSKKRKNIENNGISEMINPDEINIQEDIKMDEDIANENDVDLDESIKRLLRSTEKLKRKLLNKKKKKKAKSLFHRIK